MSTLLFGAGVAAICTSAALLAGCSGGGANAPAMLPASQLLPGAQFGSMPVTPNRNRVANELFVSDFATGAVAILKNKTYKFAGTITQGLDGPDGIWLDASNNLYVANYAGVDVTEYAPRTHALSFTYAAGMIDPIGVSADENGNVYEADYADGGNGFVNEYVQASNTVTNSCRPGGSVTSVAVDEQNDVFVSYINSSTGATSIAEYKGGLSGCKATLLPSPVSGGGSIVLDKHASLLHCDAVSGVDIIKKPYKKVTSKFATSLGACGEVTINSRNSLAFLTSPENAELFVVRYPSGSLVATLGSANGLGDPASAVGEPNAVY